MTDPIADMLSRIRNATLAKQARVEMPSSRLKVEIARILESEGYIQGFKVLEPEAGKRVQAVLRVFLKYGPRGERVITGIERVSRPGRRVYFGRDDVPDVLAGTRHQHPDDVARRDDRPRRGQGRRRRRSALQRVVGSAVIRLPAVQLRRRTRSRGRARLNAADSRTLKAES